MTQKKILRTFRDLKNDKCFFFASSTRSLEAVLIGLMVALSLTPPLSLSLLPLNALIFFWCCSGFSSSMWFLTMSSVCWMIWNCYWWCKGIFAWSATLLCDINKIVLRYFSSGATTLWPAHTFDFCDQNHPARNGSAQVFSKFKLKKSIISGFCSHAASPYCSNICTATVSPQLLSNFMKPPIFNSFSVIFGFVPCLFFSPTGRAHRGASPRCRTTASGNRRAFIYVYVYHLASVAVKFFLTFSWYCMGK